MPRVKRVRVWWDFEMTMWSTNGAVSDAGGWVECGVCAARQDLEFGEGGCAGEPSEAAAGGEDFGVGGVFWVV